MKKILSLAIHAAFVSTAFAQGLTPLYPQVDCGVMVYRQPSTYIVEFRNTCNEAVEIKKVDTGCGCTSASYTKGHIQPGGVAQVCLTFDCKELGHFIRDIRVYSSSASMREVKADSVEYSDMLVRGCVIAKKVDFSGNYQYKLGSLMVDKDNIEFDDVNQGQRLTQEIHVMNPMSQNVQPVLLRLPAYITTEMMPAILGPNQSGVMKVTLNSAKLRDFGLNQTTVFLGKSPSDKYSSDKTMTVSAILLPPAVSKDDVTRPYSAKLSLSKDYIDMSQLNGNTKYTDEITISNTGRKTLEIQKVQLFTTGLQVSLNKQSIEPGETATLRVTCKANDLKKLRLRPRILMITNDPDHQKVLIEVKE